MQHINWEQLAAQAGLLVIAAGALRWLINTTLATLRTDVKALQKENETGEERHREYDKAITALETEVRELKERLRRAGA